MNFHLIPGTLLCVSAWMQGLSDTLAAQRERGDALVQHLRAQAPAEALTNTGVLRMRDGSGRRRQVPVTIATWPDDGGWKVRYEARAASNGPVETLVVAFFTNRPPSYQSLPASPTAPTSPRSFAGTDFWWCDLGLEFLHWPDQRVVKQEMSNGRLCWALDSYNPGTNGYASVRSWVDAEFNALLRAEAYDSQRRKVKEFSTGTFREVKGRDGGDVWMLRDIRMRDDLKDSRTELLYDLPR